jgi:hypothetical protein
MPQQNPLGKREGNAQRSESPLSNSKRGLPDRVCDEAFDLLAGGSAESGLGAAEICLPSKNTKRLSSIGGSRRRGSQSLEWRNHSEHEDGKVSRAYWPRSHERRSLTKQVELLLERCLETQVGRAPLHLRRGLESGRVDRLFDGSINLSTMCLRGDCGPSDF